MNPASHFSFYLLYFFCYILKCANTCQYINSQVKITTVSEPSILVEQQLSDEILTQQENVGFGVWMNYQPYLQIGIINSREFFSNIHTNGYKIIRDQQFLYSVSQKSSGEKIIVVAASLNQNDQQIYHNVFYKFKTTQNTLEFAFDPLNYEGRWILFYCYLNFIEEKTTIGFYQFGLSQPIMRQDIDDIPSLEQSLMHQSGGLSYYINENKYLILLQQFKGSFSCALSAGSTDFDTTLQQCNNNIIKSLTRCFVNQFQLIGQPQDFLGSNYFMKQKQTQHPSIYYIQGWAKLNSLAGIQYETLLIRITINMDYNDDLFIGDRDFYIKYYQNVIPQLNGFEIGTYSYKFPLKVRYQTLDDLKIKIFGSEYVNALTNWHYFRYQIGGQVENTQPLYQVYFPEFDEIKQFKFSHNIQHFSKQFFLILIGGDEYQQNYMKGSFSNLIISFICKAPPKFNVQCHYSCQECKGPTKFDCLSCPSDSFRSFSILQSTCSCQSNYIDVDYQIICQNSDQAFLQISIKEIQISCESQGFDLCGNQIQCSFGYFQFKNQCIQCPYFDNTASKTKISCLECLIHPESFSENLVCSTDAFAFNQDLKSSFQILNNSQQNTQYFYLQNNEFGQYFLQLCQGCEKNSCKSGYYFNNNECVQCIKNCLQCDNLFNCLKCNEGYYVNFYKICQKCDDCKDCGFEYIINPPSFELVCYTCLNGKNGFPDNLCIDCGANCQDCDSFGYCNYCSENQEKYYQLFDGKNCALCNIENCLYCFQYIQSQDFFLTTLDLKFTLSINNNDDIKLACALCKPNYFFNFITEKCEMKSVNDGCEFAVVQIDSTSKCIIGPVNINSIQNNNCNEINYCQQCIKNYIQSNSFCILCMDGYYAGVLSGQCLTCPIGCKTCVQQNIQYKDSWKWKIKAFYKYFIDNEGDHSFEIYATTNTIKDLEVICTSCPEKQILFQNNCVSGCSESCEKCEIILGNATCTQCPTFNDIQLRSQDDQGSCLICPRYCSACQSRSQEEIKQINPYFVVTNYNIKDTNICFEIGNETAGYFIDTSLFKVNSCLNSKKCKQQVTITNTVYCDQSDYFSKLNEPNLEMQNVQIRYFFQDIHLYYLESQTTYDYLNEIQPSHIIYEFYFKLGNSAFCQIQTDTTPIAVQIMQRIFSVQQVDIKFIGLENRTKIKITNQLIISNFTNITFQNLEFDFSQINVEPEYEMINDELVIINPNSVSGFFHLNNLKEEIFLQIENCTFTTLDQSFNYSVSFSSVHSYSVLLENVLISNLRITQSKLFTFTSKTENSRTKIQMRQLTIQNSEFIETTVIDFLSSKFSLNSEIQIEQLKIFNSKFCSSAFINSLMSQNFLINQIKIKDFNIEKTTLSNSSILFVENAIQQSIEQLFVNDSIFDQGSSFYFSNIISLSNCNFDGILLKGNSYLICNQIQTELDTLDQFQILIQDCKFQNIQYDSSQQLIKITQPIDQQRIKLQFYAVQIYNNYLNGIFDSQQVSYRNAAIYLECQVCIFDSLDIIRRYGLPEIAIMNSQEIRMKNVQITQNRKYYPSVLHSQIQCVKQLFNFNLSFVFYFGKYQNIQLQNIVLDQSLSFNSPFFIFKGYDLLETVKQETITIKDSIFKQNTLIIYQEFSSSSILYFDSQQNSIVELINLQFLNNHLNQYYQDQNLISATTIVVQKRQGLLRIEDCHFIENIITNSSDSILFVQTEKTILKNVNFLRNNIIQYLKFIDTLLLSFENKNKIFLDDILSIFPIHSQSGNGYFIVQDFIADNIQINQSQAIQGGGFSLILKGLSSVKIINSQFYLTQTTLDNSFQSTGGCLYLDAQQSILNFVLTNVSIYNAMSRTEGGGIYILPSFSFNQIKFSNLQIKDCFSLKNSFLSYKLSKLSKFNSTFELESTTIYQDEIAYNKFIQNIQDFTSLEAQSFVNNNPFIYTLYGKVSIQNCSFFKTYKQFSIFFEEAEEIIMQNIRFINSTIDQSPIIKLSLRQFQGGQIILKGLEFNGIKQEQSDKLSNLTCFEKDTSNQFIELDCPKSMLFETKIEFEQLDNQKILQNQLICNLKQIVNLSDFQFSFLEVQDLKYSDILKIDNVIFKSNQCHGCYYGLIKIFSRDQNSSSPIILEQLQVLNNTCGLAGCISLIRNSEDSPFRTDLIDNRILNEQSLEEQLEKMKFDCLLKNSQFINNSAIYGGSLFIVESQFLIANSQFYYNKGQIGGAIYFFSNSKLLVLLKSKISQNQAQIAGGLFLNQQSLQELKQFQVELSDNNSTLFGDDFFEVPRSLSLKIENQAILDKFLVQQSNFSKIERIIIQPYKVLGQKNLLKYLTFPSGRQIGNYEYFDEFQQELIHYNLTFRIIPLNKFNKQIKGLNGLFCNITPQAMNSRTDDINEEVYFALSYYNVSYNSETEDFNLDDLIIYFNPNYDESLYLRLTIQCDFVSVPIYDSKPPYLIIDYLKNYQLQVDIKTFKCQLGEFLNITSGGCVLCDSFQNQYQVSLNALNCSYKDDVKMKSIQSSMIELRPHYWRAYYYSSTVENCYHLEENCLGGWLPGDSSCIEGHIGALCEQCDLYNLRGDGSFSISSIFSCGSCQRIAVNVISIILISLWTLISTVMSVQSTVEMIDGFIIELKLKQFGIALGRQTASTAILIKIFTNYLQIISTITTFQFQVPVELQTSFNSVGNPIEQMSYSLDCFLILISDIEIIYFRIIWSLIMALFYLQTFCLLGIIGRFSNYFKFSFSHMSTTLLYIFIFLQPNLIKGLISLLSCRVISDEHWIQGNVAYRCDSSQHIMWTFGFGLPFLVIFGFLLPFYFWYGINKNKDNLDKISMRKCWGYLYNEYKQHSYYWETIKITQKELIIIVLVYYDDNIPIKASLVFLILFWYSYSTQQIKPYTTCKLNHLDSQSTIVCAISIILGSSIYSAQQQNLQEIKWPFYIVICFLNFFYIAQMILKICFAYFQKLHQTVDKIKEFLGNAMPSLINLHISIKKIFEQRSIKLARIKKNYFKIKTLIMPQIRLLLQYKKNNLFIGGNQQFAKIEKHFNN